jgi:hypothetical protein
LPKQVNAGRKIAPAEAARFRGEVIARLNAVAPSWSNLSNDALSRLLIAQKITTATGKRFDPDRVREFRRALAKVECESPYGYNPDTTAVAEKMRLWLLAIVADCRHPIPDERRAEIDKQLTWIGMTLLEDRWANFPLLNQGYVVAERAFGRDG